MKTSYHRQHNHKRQFSRVVLVLLTVSVFIAILSQFGVLTSLIRTTYVYTYKAINGVQEVTEKTSQLFLPKATLLRENQQLRSTIQKLTIAKLHSEALKQENNELRDLFINSQGDTKKSALGHIINYNTLPYGTMLITVEGGAVVQPGDIAHFGKWAIGSVVESSNNIALIKLFTSSGSAYNVLVGDTLATFQGASNGIGKILLPHNVQVDIGTAVTIPSQKGLLLGTVEERETTKEAALQTLFVRTPFNLNTLRFITIDTR